jgi:hypothetical protein
MLAMHVALAKFNARAVSYRRDLYAEFRADDTRTVTRLVTDLDAARYACACVQDRDGGASRNMSALAYEAALQKLSSGLNSVFSQPVRVWFEFGVVADVPVTV